MLDWIRLNFSHYSTCRLVGHGIVSAIRHTWRNGYTVRGARRIMDLCRAART